MTMVANLTNRSRRPIRYRSFRYRLPHTLWLLTALVSVTTLHGQQESPTQRHMPRLARACPADVGLFIEFAPMASLQRRLDSAGLWSMIEQIVGSRGSPWHQRLSDSLGVDSDRTLKRLMRLRFAVAAPSWDRLDRGVILFELSPSLPRRHVLRLLAGTQQPQRVTRQKNVSEMKLPSGLTVVASNSVAAIGQSDQSAALLQRVGDLLKSDAPSSRLIDSAPFRDNVAQLTQRFDACAYWRRRIDPTSSRPAASDRFLPRMAHALLAVQLKADQVEFTIHDLAPPSEPYRFRPRVRVDRIQRLPQSTLAVWATAIDANQAFQSLMDNRPDGPAGRLLQWFDENIDAEAFQREVLARLAARTMVLLGCEFSSQQRLPQLGIIIESPDSEMIVQRIAQLAVDIRDDLQHDQPDQQRTKITRSSYLGYTIYEVKLPSLAGASNNALATLLTDNLRPAFCALSDSVVASTSVEQIRQIIAAANGMSPSLDDVLNIQTPARQMRRSVDMAVIQPAFALGTLRHWQVLIDRRLRAAVTLTDSLGIRIRRPNPPGQLVIDSVSSNGPSVNVLQTGDAIVACDGWTLPLEGPDAYLRKRLSHRSAGPLRLRVLRDGTMRDVQVTLTPVEVPVDVTGLEPIWQLIEPIEPMARRAPLAMYGVNQPPRRSPRVQLLIRLDAVTTDESAQTDDVVALPPE